MSTLIYEDDKVRVVVRSESLKDTVVAEVSCGKDSMDKPKFRPAKTKDELQQVLTAFALHIHEQQVDEFYRANPRGGPGDR